MKASLTEEQIKNLEDNVDNTNNNNSNDDKESRMKRWKFIYPFMTAISESVDYFIKTINFMKNSVIKLKFNSLGYYILLSLLLSYARHV